MLKIKINLKHLFLTISLSFCATQYANTIVLANPNPYAGVDMTRDANNPALPYNFKKYYGETIKYYIERNITDFKLELDGQSYTFNIKKALEEALQEWKEALAKGGVALNFEEAINEENANFIIIQNNQFEIGGLEMLSIPPSISQRGFIPTGTSFTLENGTLITANQRLDTGILQIAPFKRISDLWQKSYNNLRSLFTSPRLFFETQVRYAFKHELGHQFGIVHVLPTGQLPDATRIRVIDYAREPILQNPPDIMGNNADFYMRELAAYRNLPETDTRRFLIPDHIEIPDQDAEAVARAVNMDRFCTPHTRSNDTDAAGPSHRDPRSISPTENSGICLGTFDDIVAGDIRQIEVSKLINGVPYHLQASLSDGGYYNTNWGKDAAHPLTMIALTNPTKMQNVPAELGEIDYVKVNLNDGYDHHKAALASYYYEGTGGFGSGVDSDARDAIYLNRDQDMDAHTYGLIHYLVRIKGGTVAPNGERFFIMTAEQGPWEEPITLQADHRLCWLTNYAMPKSDNNPHTGLSDGQYNAQFKCRKLNAVDSVYDQAEVSLSQKVIARGLDHFIKNRKALDFSKSYSAYVGMINPREGQSYHGYCGWGKRSMPGDLYNLQMDCSVGTLGEPFQIHFSPVGENETVLGLSLKADIEGHGQWSLSSRNAYHDYTLMSWLGEKDYSLVFAPDVDGHILRYRLAKDGSGSLSRWVGHRHDSVQYSQSRGKAICSPATPLAHDVKLNGAYAKNKTANPPDPALISIMLNKK